MRIHRGDETVTPTDSNLVEVRNPETIWINGAIDGRKLPVNPARVTIHGTFIVPKTGVYKFYLGSDDGSKLYIDGNTVIINWAD
jgi:hypothetical protein